MENPKKNQQHQKKRPIKATVTKPKRRKVTAVVPSDAWDWYIARLQEFKEKYGTANVPKKSKDYPILAKWVVDVRRRVLSPAQIAQLQELGFTWTCANMERFSQQWETMFQRLQAYRRVHGDCLVSTTSKEDRTLGIWVKNQRAYHRKVTLSKERQKKLLSIGFVWSIGPFLKVPNRSPQLERLWRKKFDDLLQFREKNGHCRVPVIHPENQALGDWINNQRTAFSEKRMREDRKKMLDEIGFSWKPRSAPKIKRIIKKRQTHFDHPLHERREIPEGGHIVCL
jgi:hypothetical protein